MPRSTPAVIAALQARLSEEDQALRQYRTQRDVCRNLGYFARAEHYDALYEAELEHAHELGERLLFLGEIPDPNLYVRAEFGHEPVTMIDADHDAEQTAAEHYRDTAALCLRDGDFGTLGVIQHILAEEEEHLTDVEAAQAQVQAMGQDNWLSLQVDKGEAD